MFDSHTPTETQILRPLDLTEVISTKAAAKMAGRTTVTIREWCRQFNIGRQVAGRWLVSAPAFLAFLEGDQAALNAYLAGDRESDLVLQYYVRTGVPLPQAGVPVPQASDRLHAVGVGGK